MLTENAVSSTFSRSAGDIAPLRSTDAPDAISRPTQVPDQSPPGGNGQFTDAVGDRATARKTALIQTLGLIDSRASAASGRSRNAQEIGEALRDIETGLQETLAGSSAGTETSSQAGAQNGNTAANATSAIADRIAEVRDRIRTFAETQSRPNPQESRAGEFFDAPVSDTGEDQAPATAFQAPSNDPLQAFTDTDFDLESTEGVEAAIEASRSAIAAADREVEAADSEEAGGAADFRIVGALLSPVAGPVDGTIDTQAALDLARQTNSQISRLSLPITSGVEQQLRGY